MISEINDITFLMCVRENAVCQLIDMLYTGHLWPLYFLSDRHKSSDEDSGPMSTADIDSLTIQSERWASKMTVLVDFLEIS